MNIADTLSPEQAAPRLGKSAFTVEKYCREKLIHAAKIGRVWRIQPAEIDRVLTEGTLPKPGPKKAVKRHAR